MPNKKQPAAVAVASTGCSRLMSYLSLRRAVLLHPSRPSQDAPSPPNLALDGAVAAEQYWRRVQHLEEELKKLDKWLSQEKKLTQCLKTAKAREESSSKRCLGHGGVQEMVRLEDGSYLHEIRRVGRPWGRLVMQVSLPIVAENAPNASEVLRKMTLIKIKDLCKFLVELMPMKDITSRQKPGEIIRRPVRLNTRDDLMEDMLFSAMEKMEGLVLEGLKIQMGSANDAAAVTERREKDTLTKDCMVHMVLIQVRDPQEGYGAIGELMIGLIEASWQSKEGKIKSNVEGLHVAGMSFTRNRRDVRDMLWSASLRHCKGCHNSSSSSCNYVRNPNRVFIH